MTTSNNMEEYFGNNGLLAQKIPNYEYRPLQEQMASRIWDMFSQQTHYSIAMEAATGLGKTYAALVPALLWARQCGKRVLFLTASLTLQEQLITRDLPILLATLGMSLSFGNLKGRNNYVCRRLAQELFSQGYLSFQDSGAASAKVISWLAVTEKGELSELDLPSDHPVLSQICSSFRHCLGQHCPYKNICFPNRVLKESREWDVVVSNYHLFFSFLTRGKGSLPFNPDIIICDEAHKMADAARNASDMEDSMQNWASLFSSRNRTFMEKKLLEYGLPEGPLKENTSLLLNSISTFFDNVEKSYADREGINSCHEVLSDPKARTLSLIDECQQLFKPLKERLAQSEERMFMAVEDSRLWGWINEFDNACSSFRFVTDTSRYPEWSYWKEGASLFASPTRCSSIIPACFKQVGHEQEIFLSATLTIDGQFLFWKEETGISPDAEFIYPSEFALEKNMEIWVVDIGCSVMDNSYDQQVCRVVEKLCDENAGKSLVLVSSRRLLTKLRAFFEKSGKPYRILVQGDKPKGILLDIFRDDVNSVLLGMVSFREGIDVPGESLTQVIIDRIPFPHPNDPVIRARNELEGYLSFSKVTLPVAKMVLKQAAGRLIRSKSDQGRVIILDKRVVERDDWDITGVLPAVKYRYLKTKGGIVA